MKAHRNLPGILSPKYYHNKTHLQQLQRHKHRRWCQHMPAELLHNHRQMHH